MLRLDIYNSLRISPIYLHSTAKSAMGAGHFLLVATALVSAVIAHGTHESENSKSDDWAVSCDLNCDSIFHTDF